MIRSLRRGRIRAEYPSAPNFGDISDGSWRYGCIYDEEASKASVSGLNSSSDLLLH